MGKYGRQHIGKTFNEGKLTVVDGGDKKDYVKVKCSICEKDKELFGSGIFETASRYLLRGSVPCGCSKSYRYSISQRKLLILRLIEERKLPVELVEVFTIRNNKKESVKMLKLLCLRTQVVYSCDYGNFVKGTGNNGVSECTGITEGYTQAECEKYNRVNSEVITWDSGKKCPRGGTMIAYYCKKCASLGLESTYLMTTGNIFRKNKIPCRCSPSSRKTLQDYADIATLEFPDFVIGAVDGKVGADIVFLCPIHGTYRRKYSNCSIRSSACLKCNPPKSGYQVGKMAYLYLLEINTILGTVLGYGITNKLATRISSHKRNLKSIGATITNIQVFEGSGTAVLAVENDIKSLHTTGLLDCEGFRRESISIDMKDKVLEKCKKLKQLDNVDKLI